MTTSVGNIAIYVTDLERSERFYVDVLGLSVRARITADVVDEVILGAADGVGSALMLARAKPVAAPVVPSGIWKIFLDTDDVATLFDAAVSAGASAVMAPTRLEQYRVTIAMVTDPDGYVVEFGHVDAR